ncbi:hypothetical protein BDV27DRAFT_126126 [Aspergillus caelatus]|uniref:Uncharacterized protein n=1 Tax=Aspergillus caelatus TaxID=61420 RepID=A0A5N7A7L3_9EURO|nr:uncharacterized protein BDV27DRAFT_126126 [Aspergillus caelatus]KAE8365847.1 hypothetical protein BDV27DRAFT_126126 [Aspergillus caelatus]
MLAFHCSNSSLNVFFFFSFFSFYLSEDLVPYFVLFIFFFKILFCRPAKRIWKNTFP